MAISSPAGATVAAGALLLYVLVLIIYRLYFHPLAKFPGSKLAAATQFYEIYYDVVKKGRFIWELERMHARYGPIIRINPDELHVKDSEYYDTIYTNARHKRDKYDKYAMMAAPTSMLSTVDHDLHRSRRQALAPFFAKRSVIRLEQRISDKVITLCNRLAGAMEEGRVLELATVFTALTMDVITEYSYGKSYDELLKDNFAAEWRAFFAQFSEDNIFRRHVPWLSYVMQKLPVNFLMRLVPAFRLLLDFESEMQSQVETILNKRGTGEKESDCIFKVLRDDDQLPEHEKSVQRLTDEALLLIGAGTVTTAETLAWTTFYIIDTPGVLQRLRAELATAVKSSEDMPRWTELEQLPYLTAVISEGLRLSYGLSTRLPRVAHEALRYGDWVIPPRTPISSSSYFVHIDPSVFPEPEKFRPERWMQDGKRLDRYLTNFSKGTRGCLGLNLAYAELYLTLGTIFRKFDFELYETTIEDVRMDRDTFVPAAKVGSKGVRVVVKSIA